MWDKMNYLTRRLRLHCRSRWLFWKGFTQLQENPGRLDTSVAISANIELKHFFTKSKDFCLRINTALPLKFDSDAH